MPDKINISEHIETLFEGVSDVKPEEKEKMTTVIESAVNAIVSVEVEKLQEQAEVDLEKRLAEHKETLNTQTSKYLDYVISEWTEKNEMAITTGLQFERAEAFMEGVTELMSRFGMKVSSEQENLVSVQESKIAELTERLNECARDILGYKDEIKEFKREKIVATVTEGLTDTQKEKFSSLVSGFEFTDSDSFESKCKTIRESYFADKADKGEVESINESAKPDAKPDATSILRNPYKYKL